MPTSISRGEGQSRGTRTLKPSRETGKETWEGELPWEARTSRKTQGELKEENVEGRRRTWWLYLTGQETI